MKIFCRLVYLLFLAGHALAQPVAELARPDDGSNQRELRRIELRLALEAQRQAGETREAKRQLTPAEREELRLQLRQQQHQGTVGPRP
jgi:hypothetical protein